MKTKRLNKANDSTDALGSIMDGLGSLGEGVWGAVADAVADIATGIADSVAQISMNQTDKDAENYQYYWQTRNGRVISIDRNIGFYIIVGLMIAAITAVIILSNRK